MTKQVPEYVLYQDLYIRNKPFCGLAPLLIRRNKGAETKAVVIHTHDHFEQFNDVNRRLVKIMRCSTIKLNELYRQKRDAVHRFVIINNHVYLDPWFRGVRDSPLFNQCVWIDPTGLTPYEHNLCGKLAIRLGGFVTKDIKYFTSVIVKKAEHMAEEETGNGLYISIETLLDLYRNIYERNFNLF